MLVGVVGSSLATVRPISGRLPDFLVIGAPRAGTTTLARDLGSLPSVWLPRQKELGFFDVRWDDGIDAYRRQFAPAPPGTVVGEATPTYLSAPGALERIATTVPDVRLVAILRDPVARFWSHYWYNRTARAVEHRDPAEVLDTNPGEYVEPGRYGHHLTRAAALFERSQLHVVMLPALQRDPVGTYRSLVAHLGIGDEVPGDAGGVRNESYAVRVPWIRRQMLRHRLWARLPGDLGYRIDEWNRVPVERPQMPDDLRARVAELYADDLPALEAFLGSPPPWELTR